MRPAWFTICLFLIFGMSLSPSAQELWTKSAANPVIPRTIDWPNWDAIACSDPCVLLVSDTLKMWVSGSGWISASQDSARVRIGYLWSMNGDSWHSFSGNPVLDVGEPGQWDQEGIETISVLYEPEAPDSMRYRAWYSGRFSPDPEISDFKIGAAWSSDGLHWTRYPGNPVLVPGDSTSWENTFYSTNSVIRNGDTLKMWFAAPDLYANSQPTDFSANIGYAWSLDGFDWHKHTSPVLLAGSQAQPDSAAVAEPHVIKTGDEYHMVYSSLANWETENFQLGYARSWDGIHWIKSDHNPVLENGIPGEWDAHVSAHASLLFDPRYDLFRLWYTGISSELWYEPPYDYEYGIGYAESVSTKLMKSSLSTPSVIQIQTAPNPFNPTTKVHLDVYGPAEVLVLVTNLLGQQVAVLHDGVLDTGSHTFVLNASGLASGIYLIHVTSGYRSTTTKILLLK